MFVTATGNYNVITVDHMARMKDKAIVGNIGHFDNEIDMAGLKKLPGMRRGEREAAVRRVGVPRRPLGAGAGRGAPAEPRLRHGPPELRDVGLLLEPGARPARARPQNAGSYEKKVYVLPKKLDEEVARLHLAHLGVRLTKLSPEQAEYIGVDADGPYKPEHYRY